MRTKTTYKTMACVESFFKQIYESRVSGDCWTIIEFGNLASKLHDVGQGNAHFSWLANWTSFLLFTYENQNYTFYVRFK